MSERAKRQVGEAANRQISKSASERGDGLPEGWMQTTLGEITEPSKDRVNPEEVQQVPYIGLEHIEKNTGKLVEHGYSDEVRSTKSAFNDGDLLYGRLRPYLNKVYLADFDGICSTDILVFPENPHVSNRFLLYRLLSPDFVRYANLRMSGVQHPRIHFEDLAKFPLKLPPCGEQRRIVDAIETQFTRLDAAVAALERARANLARYRASVLQAACEGRLVPTEAELAREQDRDYEPADELLKRILAERRARWEEERWAYEIERAQKKAAQAERKAAGLPYYIRDLEPEHWQHRTPEEYEPYLPKSDKWKQKYDEPEPPDTEGLPALPEGWVYTCLEPLLDVKRPGMRTGPFGSLLKKSEHQSTGVPVLGIENIGPGGYVHGTRIHISESKALELAKYDVQPGDILISRSGTVGEVCIVPEGLGIARFSTNLMRVVLMPDGMVPELFRLLFVGDPFVLSQVSDLCSGSTRDFLNQKILSVLIFPLPPLTEQHRIIKEVERRLSVVGALEQSVEANLARAQRLRQAILKKAFEGRLVDQDPDDEPASALLARIKAQREA